jgi:predicted nucleic acid-binding Zn ribbon protein
MLDSMVAEWPALVGKAVAAHCRPGRLEKGELTVFVDSSVWLNELVRYSRQQLLSNLQAKFGRNEVRSVRVQLDPDGPAPRRPTGAGGV